MINVRKYYTWNGAPVYSHAQYKPGESLEDINSGVAKPVLFFRSYPKSAQNELIEITEVEYKRMTARLANVQMNNRINDQIRKSNLAMRAKEKLLALGLTEEEYKALFKI